MPDSSRAHPEVVSGIDRLGAGHGRLFVVVGVFDGLHLGHSYLLRNLREGAQKRGARPTVITFDHHPDEVLKGAAPPLLCDPDERLRLLGEEGVELTVVETFDRQLQQTPFDVFVRRIAERAELAGFLMTPDAAFGHERGGTPSAVAELGQVMGFDVKVIPPMGLAGRAVRSSEIRSAIKHGDLSEAAALLGRPYSILGVAAANEDGRVVLGFPMPVALPPAGTYQIRVGEGSGSQPGSITVGIDGSVVLDAPTGDSRHEGRLLISFGG
ncbi:MAG: FAD synthetase family protein [Dehalococcoidia bacterium]